MDSLCEHATESWEALYTSVRKADYAGYDPYDGLNSRLFRSTPLYRGRLARLLWIQFFRRCPVNLRSLVGIDREPNPKGLGLFMSGLVERYRATGDRAYLEEARRLSDRILSMISPGWSGACWGYNFDWQARWHGSSLVARGWPNVVVTAFVVQGLLDLFEACPRPELLEVAESAGRFVQKELVHSGEGDTCYIGYIPGVSVCVHNANLLGAAMLARLFGHTGGPRLKEIVSRAARFSVSHQQPDGAWFYSTLDYQKWIDHFHTGYNLVALRAIKQYIGDSFLEESIVRGYRYYLEKFFLENGCPKYYHDSVYPVDIHSCAQAVITPLLVDSNRDRALSLASRTLRWTLREMQRTPGQFIYQRHRGWSNPISYIRWGDAWMFYTLSLYLSYNKGLGGYVPENYVV
jgi:hypothetical protein